jgi:hypothetical protein|tara:strand:- start:377 stop:583 length:207 start_codon:yes stop_codon:yes gene_type:complete
MENNKITLGSALRNQFGLVQLALVTEREELLATAIDRLEVLIKLIPEDIDSNGQVITKSYVRNTGGVL